MLELISDDAMALQVAGMCHMSARWEEATDDCICRCHVLYD
jgi:hypothetical protein